MGMEAIRPLPLSAPALPYADLPARYGVAVEPVGDGERVVVPPVPGWRHLHAGFHIAFVALGGVLALIGCISYASGEPTMLVGGCPYAVALVCVAGVALGRLCRRIVFDVTADQVRLAFVTGGRVSRHVSWPRAAISQIKLNPFNGKLLIRITGKDLFELYLGPNTEVNQLVADTLAAALMAPIEKASPSVVRSVPEEDQRPTGPWRKALVAAGVAM